MLQQTFDSSACASCWTSGSFAFPPFSAALPRRCGCHAGHSPLALETPPPQCSLPAALAALRGPRRRHQAGRPPPRRIPRRPVLRLPPRPRRRGREAAAHHCACAPNFPSPPRGKAVWPHAPPPCPCPSPLLHFHLRTAPDPASPPAGAGGARPPGAAARVVVSSRTPGRRSRPIHPPRAGPLSPLY